MSRRVRKEREQEWAGMGSECGRGPWGEGVRREVGDLAETKVCLWACRGWRPHNGGVASGLEVPGAPGG